VGTLLRYWQMEAISRESVCRFPEKKVRDCKSSEIRKLKTNGSVLIAFTTGLIQSVLRSGEVVFTVHVDVAYRYEPYYCKCAYKSISMMFR
jgi:hypothetical protein